VHGAGEATIPPSLLLRAVALRHICARCRPAEAWSEVRQHTKEDSGAPMPTTTTLESLRKIASAKRSLLNKAKHLAEAEGRVVEEVRRLLSSLGYTLVGMDGHGAATTRRSPRSRTRKTLPKTLNARSVTAAFRSRCTWRAT